MIQTDNMYPNTARLFAKDFTGNADLPYDFFMSRYKEAYKQETLAFVDALVNDKPSPCSGLATDTHTHTSVSWNHKKANTLRRKTMTTTTLLFPPFKKKKG